MTYFMNGPLVQTTKNRFQQAIFSDHNEAGHYAIFKRLTSLPLAALPSMQNDGGDISWHDFYAWFEENQYVLTNVTKHEK